MKNKSGFTLIELMIVIAIFGILSAIAIPNYLSARPKHRAQGAARQVYTELYLAKQKAASENKAYEIQFDTTDASYEILRDDTGDKVPEFSVKTVIISNSYAGIEIGSVKFSTNGGSAGLASNIIRFLPNGITDGSNSGTVSIKPVSTTEYSQTINVSVTGHVSLN